MPAPKTRKTTKPRSPRPDPELLKNFRLGLLVWPEVSRIMYEKKLRALEEYFNEKGIFEKFKPGDINLVFDGSTITCLPVIRDLLLAPHPKTILGEFSVALNKKGIATSNLENKELEKELPIKEMLVSGPNSINTFFEFKIGLRASSLIVNKKKFKSIHGIG